MYSGVYGRQQKTRDKVNVRSNGGMDGWCKTEGEIPEKKSCKRGSIFYSRNSRNWTITCRSSKQMTGLNDALAN